MNFSSASARDGMSAGAIACAAASAVLSLLPVED